MLAAGSRRRAIAEMFEIVEAKWGSMSKLTDSVSIERGRLERGPLSRLFSHESMALVVEGFLDPRECERLGDRLASLEARPWHVSTAGGLEDSGVATPLGVPRNLAFGDDYHNTVEPATRALRDLCGGGGFASPLDRLRADLDDVWGARVARDKGKPAHAGLGRVMRGPSRGGLVHVDDLAPLRKDRGLFSANIYLKLPPAGGGLELWPVGIRSRWDFYANAPTLSALAGGFQDPASQARLRRRLPPPALVHPNPGDLVILCVQRPHAVAAFETGYRVSLQSFITHEGPTNPLLLEA
ncbi:hypothetical protein CTAYLR_004527 [Chrysophaeum taylorii]|uniref:Prolyl 4-hydroxylase alpha subunit Fe(2+) 2OG dioxygenase domain-containing protein n=1 Tax=Chrysophaeum taylorii TaxID=2483200 RepID=A0AAD7UPJ0_9STRA|nr:hypothetical protein CTAYLR_004527 [Chrysophaeum taylorii]